MEKTNLEVASTAEMDSVEDLRLLAQRGKLHDWKGIVGTIFNLGGKDWVICVDMGEEGVKAVGVAGKFDPEEFNKFLDLENTEPLQIYSDQDTVREANKRRLSEVKTVFGGRAFSFL